MLAAATGGGVKRGQWPAAVIFIIQNHHPIPPLRPILRIKRRRSDPRPIRQENQSDHLNQDPVIQKQSFFINSSTTQLILQYSQLFFYITDTHCHTPHLHLPPVLPASLPPLSPCPWANIVPTITLPAHLSLCPLLHATHTHMPYMTPACHCITHHLLSLFMPYASCLCLPAFAHMPVPST